MPFVSQINFFIKIAKVEKKLPRISPFFHVFKKNSAVFFIFANFSADEKYRAENLNQGLVKVTYNGSVSLDVPGIIRSTCRLDVTYFPFDEQFCTLKFGSWAYSGAQLVVFFSFMYKYLKRTNLSIK